MIDFNSPTWLEIKACVTQELEALRGELERPNDDIATANLRGRIQQCRKLLDMQTSAPEFAKPAEYF